MGKPIEFPPGSGKVAVYEPHEQRFMRDLVALEKEGTITSETMKTEMLAFHELKVSLGATMWDDETARADRVARGEVDPPRAQEPSDDQPSLFGTEAFPVPQRAQERLLARGGAAPAVVIPDKTPEPEPEQEVNLAPF